MPTALATLPRTTLAVLGPGRIAVECTCTRECICVCSDLAAAARVRHAIEHAPWNTGSRTGPFHTTSPAVGAAEPTPAPTAGHPNRKGAP